MRYGDIYCAEEKYVSLFLTLTFFLCYTELLSTYWNMGKIIVEHEKETINSSLTKYLSNLK